MTLKELELKVKKLERQLDNQHSTVMNLFDYIRIRTRGRKRKEILQLIESQLW